MLFMVYVLSPGQIYVLPTKKDQRDKGNVQLVIIIL